MGFLYRSGSKAFRQAGGVTVGVAAREVLLDDALQVMEKAPSRRACPVNVVELFDEDIDVLQGELMILSRASVSSSSLLGFGI